MKDMTWIDLLYGFWAFGIMERATARTSIALLMMRHDAVLMDCMNSMVLWST
jgi:hypothetical protein